MKRSILFLLGLLFPFALLLAQRQLSVVDRLGHPIVHAVVTQHPQGTLLGTTNAAGQLRIPLAVDSIGVTHVAYRSVIDAATPRMLLDSATVAVSEAVATVKRPDYYRLRTLTRVYQYIDSTLVSVLDGVVDFYVNAQGEKARYQVLQLDAYQNKKAIRGQLIARKSMVEYNNLNNYIGTDWIFYHALFGRKPDYYIDETTAEGSVRQRKSHRLSGEVGVEDDGAHRVRIDCLAPSDTTGFRLMGMYSKTLQNVREYTLLPTARLSQPHPKDVRSYREVFERIVRYGKKGVAVPTLVVEEGRVLSRKGMSEEEMKQVKTHKYPEAQDHSTPPPPEEKVQHNLPLPPAIRHVVNAEMERMPEK